MKRYFLPVTSALFGFLAVVCLALTGTQPAVAMTPSGPYANNGTHYVYKYNLPGSVSTAVDRWVLNVSDRNAAKHTHVTGYVTATHDTSDVSVSYEQTSVSSYAGEEFCYTGGGSGQPCSHAHVKIDIDQPIPYSCCSTGYQTWFDSFVCHEITHSTEGATHDDTNGATCFNATLPALTAGAGIYTNTAYQTTNAHDDGHLALLY